MKGPRQDLIWREKKPNMVLNVNSRSFGSTVKREAD